jgi:hypothetical protein
MRQRPVEIATAILAYALRLRRFLGSRVCFQQEMTFPVLAWNNGFVPDPVFHFAVTLERRAFNLQRILLP